MSIAAWAGGADEGGGTGLPDLEHRMQGDLAALDDFAREFGRLRPGASAPGDGATLPSRINADPATIEQDLGKLVLGVIELIRQLLEKQALRRMEADSLSEAEIERMGETFLKLDQKMTELKASFGLQDQDLSLNLGSLHDLLAEY